LAQISASNDEPTNDNRNEVEEEAKGGKKDNATDNGAGPATSETSKASAISAEDDDVAIYSDV